MWMAWTPNCTRNRNIFQNWKIALAQSDTFGIPRTMKKSKKTRTLPMKAKKTFAALLLIPALALGQDHLVSGTVSTQTDQPLPDATILILGKTIGTTTDVNGYFELNSPEEYPIRISVSYIGYTS